MAISKRIHSFRNMRSMTQIILVSCWAPRISLPMFGRNSMKQGYETRKQI